MLNKTDIKKIKSLLKKYPVEVGYLFGSQATGKAVKSSDYDFAVQLSGATSAKKFFERKLALTNELLKITKTKFIDIVILNNPKTPLLLKYNIIKDGKIIYEKALGKRAALEFKIIRDWLDWQYFENLWQSIFTKNLAKGKIL